ncbi:uncharacterized protein DNG_04454 [Cephalotrichum gorgonifer]|uniref:Reverse transcriptase domain-containing protein n=1 Tax=Cephalotrichum gorgonifer TaxID=2041049 RepID=A0AAE8MW54_9PEZI|nr:uncharacterized protein DNG_04454 [Cephalotrichum gorgonifer]
MAPAASVLSQTLKSISLTKIREISKQRAKYEDRKDAVLAKAAEHSDSPHRRIDHLLQGVKDLYPEALSDHKVKNVRYWVQQSRYDSSVPPDMLESCEALLRGKLEVQSRRLALAHLYSRLVTEWMEPAAPMNGESPATINTPIEDAERQKERLQELCDRFEEVVFSPLETDEVQIDLYMNGLFPSEDSNKALAALRKKIGDESDSLMRSSSPFTNETLNWSIRALLAEDLLSDEKQVILRDFLENDMVLGEIADVLNMRFADFDSWEWDAGPDGIPVLPRQQLNGKYRIWMDEDVLQAIFVEYVGIRCCNLLSDKLKDFVQGRDNDVWRWGIGPSMGPEDDLRRRYYLGGAYSIDGGVNSIRKQNYDYDFFLSQLPDSPTALGAGSYDNDGDDQDDGQGWSNIKQYMLRTLATETMVHLSLRHEAAVVQSDLKWYATGLSHATIFAVMRFFGFPEKLISFYRKALQAPLNLSPSSDGASGGGPRTRQRGVPIAHATEKFIGELILFAMDLAVNRDTGMLLYRLHDDLFLVGEPARCAKAWKTMNVFAGVMGLEFNMHKTGSVYLTDNDKAQNPDVAQILPKGTVQIGHLALDPESGNWVIDQEQVGEHVAQLKKQLGACGSILGWVQTWNSCIGRFFSHTFGEPGYCFGREHIDSILETYRKLNRVLFGDDVADQAGGEGSAVQYLKGKIRERFEVSDIPDAFLLLPEEMGGLGLRNPFIPLLVLREKVIEDMLSPGQVLQKAFEAEREAYAVALKKFTELGTTEERLRQLRGGYSDTDAYRNAKKHVVDTFDDDDLDNFFSFEEYMRFSETTSPRLREAYVRLTSTPQADGPIVDDDVETALRSAGISLRDESPKAKEARWALQMFRVELRDTVGELRLVEKNLLPLGVLAMMRQKAVKWTMVL